MKTYISHQLARSKGPLCYRKAKNGFMMLVNHAKNIWWMGYNGQIFYLIPFDPTKGQSEQLKNMR